MYSFVELIQLIEKRPPMYLGKRYISCLRSFIQGWQVGNNDHLEKNFGRELSHFQEWIQKKFTVTSTQGWDSIILFYSTDEVDALTNFFRLFNEWLSERE